MAEVTNNASRGAVLSNKNNTTAPQYDLRSWQGLTEVLKRAREAGLSDSLYAEFRNMVLSYAQTGGDPEMRKKIDTVVASFTVSQKTAPQNIPVTVPKSAPAPDSLPIATPGTSPAVADTPSVPLRKDHLTEPRRNVSSFMPKHVGVATPEEPVDAPQPAPLTQMVRHVVEAPVPTPAEEVVPPVAPVVETAQPLPVTPVSVLPPVVEHELPPPAPAPVREVPVAEVVIPAPAAVPPPPPAPQPVVARSGFPTLDEHKARIAEIKRTVHTEIGNPITLVDAGNPVGREYMTALLTAMKASGNGGQGLDAAMEKLERAFVSACDAAKKAKLHGEGTATTPAPTPPPPPVLREEPTVPEPPLVPEPVVELPDRIPMAEPLPDRVLALEPDRAPISIAPQIPEPTPLPIVDEQVIEVETRIPEPAAAPLAVETPVIPESEVLSAPESAIPRGGESISEPDPLINKYVDAGVGRVEFDPVSQTMGQVPLEVASRQSDLASSEITTALNQLLHEWSMFEGSGLFGIGPGGAEHPLYKKLASLSMGEVLAGRWERATPEIRRTLKDYVDAWRHEQGIAYNPTENFEHYLRRVVQRILKRQKGEPDA